MCKEIAPGSPPHVRGKGFFSGSLAACCRITPACAGKRSGTLIYASTARDHPRMCGEKFLVFVPYSVLWGSPPHVRGKVVKQIIGCIAVGITPACAGKSGLQGSARLLRWDHPRVCGEKKPWKTHKRNAQGSPPRMRGKDSVPGYVSTWIGITPAYAGKRRGLSHR